MSRKPPAITSVSLQSDGSVQLEWGLDMFFPEPEAPDEVWVELPRGVASPIMPGSTTAFSITASDVRQYKGSALTGSVVFKWVGPPDDVQGSAFSYPVTGSPPGSTANGPPVPVVTLVDRRPKTLQHENQITLNWSSYSYQHANIIWGPQHDPRQFTHNIDPHGAVYSGQFTTDRPLAARTIYQFLVQVKNDLTTNIWVDSTITIGSSTNFRSVRQFLAASQAPAGRGIRVLLHGSRSLRSSMGR